MRPAARRAATATAASSTTARAPAWFVAAAPTALIAAVDPAQAREEAHQILSSRRFKGSPVPRPLHGVLRWIGDRLSPIGRWIGDRLSWLPGPDTLWYSLFGLITIAVVGYFLVSAIAKAQARNRGTGPDDAGTASGPPTPGLSTPRCTSATGIAGAASDGRFIQCCSIF